MTSAQIRNCVEIGQRMSSLGANLLLQGDLLSDLGEVAARLQDSDAQRTALTAIYQRACASSEEDFRGLQVLSAAVDAALTRLDIKRQAR